MRHRSIHAMAWAAITASLAVAVLTVAVPGSAEADRRFRTEGCDRLTKPEVQASEELATRIEEQLLEVKGYSIAVAQDCLLAAVRSGGIAVTSGDAPDGLVQPMTGDHRSAMGSVAKLFTATAILRELDAQGIAPTETVDPYLAMFWDLAEVGYDGGLSWANLMAQQSGIESGNTTTALSYEDLGALLADAMGGAEYNYDNANAGLLRILLWGLVNGSAPAGDAEAIEDATAAFFEAYLVTNLFDPAGVTGVRCAPIGPAPYARLYQSQGDAIALPPPSTAYMLEVCGPGGWFLSSVEALRFVVYLQHTDLLVPFDTADDMMTDRWGWESLDDESFPDFPEQDSVLFKAGSFETGRACVVDFRNGTEVAVVINSPEVGARQLCAAIPTAYYDPSVWT